MKLWVGLKSIEVYRSLQIQRNVQLFSLLPQLWWVSDEKQKASIVKNNWKMNFLITFLILCFYTFTQAIPLSSEQDLAVAEPLPALVDRSASIPPGDGPVLPSCWTNLKCSFHEIEAMSLPTRLSYVRYLETRFTPLHAANQFRAIEGVIEFFISKGLGGQGTWVSYVDAGIVEAIQRGGAIALGIGTSKGGNPGSALWADFLTKEKNHQLNDRNVKAPNPSTSLIAFQSNRIINPRTTITTGPWPNKPPPATAKPRPNPPAKWAKPPGSNSAGSNSPNSSGPSCATEKP